MQLYVLTLRGVPVDAAWRFERLNERVGDGKYSREDQQHMAITPVDILT